jgi:hypothetical protein
VGQCPYGDAPEIASSDGEEPDATKGNWTIDGQPRNVFDPICDWIVSAPDACADCLLNPDNKPAASAEIAHLFRLESLHAAGATFLYGDLTEREWNGLLIIKAERNRRMLEDAKKPKK